MRFNYLSTDQDRREWIEAVRIARDILTQPAFEPVQRRRDLPGPSVETDEEILDWVRDDAETALHPSCTAKMGVDDDGGRRSRHDAASTASRVCALSMPRSCPYVTNGNIYAPVMMLAEKAADLILGNTPLAPSEAPFYRYDEGSPLYPPGDPRNEGASS